jgi:hypothetical protein
MEVEDDPAGFDTRGGDVVAVVDEHRDSAELEEPVRVRPGPERSLVPGSEPVGVGGGQQDAAECGRAHAVLTAERRESRR